MSSFNVKNLIIYRLTRNIDFSDIEEQLSHLKYEPCGSLDMSRFGFVPPLGIGESDNLVHAANNQYLISLMKEEKILPSPVVNKELQKRISAIELDQGRKIHKLERQSLKDDVIQGLLPRAFSKYTRFDVWVNITDGFIAALVSSPRRAEDCFAMIRKAIGSLPVVPLTAKDPIELTLTEWVKKGELPKGFVLGEQSEMKAILEEGGIAKFTHQDLVSDEILSHIEAGKLVTKLALGFDGKISFNIDDRFIITKIIFNNEINFKNDDIDSEDYNQRFDADFFLITSELNILINNLITVFGGEVSH